MRRNRNSANHQHKHILRRILLSLCVFALLVSVGAFIPDTKVYAQAEDRYYSETGHTLDARFVGFFDNQGGIDILGYPITDSFIDPISGWVTQYLQNARMELVLDPASGEMVPILSSLGQFIHGWNPIDTADRGENSSPGCLYYPESGYEVCHAFLEFYNRNGGVYAFGLPISDFTLENDRIVQYFQGFRLDWYPNAGVAGEVKIARLGRLHFDMVGYDSDLLKPILPSNRVLHRVVDIELKAAIGKPIVGSTDVQELILLVRDQNLNTIEGAAVTIFAHYPDGEHILVMPATDADGISRLRIAIDDVPPGTTILLEFWVVYGEIIRMTQDSFMVWW